MQNAMENNNKLSQPLIYSCLNKVMDRYRVSISNEYSKIDTCIINQRTINCTNEFSEQFEREIKITSNIALDNDLYMWRIGGIHLPFTPPFVTVIQKF